MFIIVNLTLRRFRLVIGNVFGTSEFLDETEPLISSFLICTASPDPSPWKTGLRSKQLSSKCAEHKHDDFLGSKTLRNLFGVCGRIGSIFAENFRLWESNAPIFPVFQFYWNRSLYWGHRPHNNSFLPSLLSCPP